MRVLKALGATVVLIALIAGVPALLLAWGKPLALMDVDWSTVLFRPDTGIVVLGILSIAGWVAWLILTAATVMELIAQLSRHRFRLRLPGVTWLQPVVGGLVAMAMTPLLPTHAEEPPPTIAAHAPVTPTGTQPTPSHPPVDPPVRSHVVRQGEELWGVAERELGSGSRWRAIVACNPGMSAESPLVPGSTIHLPQMGVPAASGAPSSDIRITVRRGDTLWDLAREHLGDPGRWPELFEANRDVITDPDEIDVGWELIVPAEPKRVVVDPEEPDEVVVDDVTPQPVPPPTSTPPGGATATPHIPDAPPRHVDPKPAEDPEPVLDILGPVGGVLAVSLVAGIAARRRVQLLHRGIGRRIHTLSPHLQRFFTALVHRSRDAGDELHEPSPTSVVMGWDDEGDLHVDVEGEGCTVLVGSDEDTAALSATVLTSLLSADWSTSVDVVAVQPHDDWTSALDDPRLETESVLDDALHHLQLLCAQRRLQLGHATLSEVRADENRADAWVPVVFVFATNLHPGHLDKIRDCLTLGRVGVSAVAATSSAPPHHDGAAVLTIESQTHARLENTGRVFQPQLLTQPARRAVMSLFAAALEEATHAAPWWPADDNLPHPTVNVLPQKAEEPLKDDAMPAWSPPPDRPTLLVLGPVELHGARGTPPVRAMGQCMEYCAWLLLHPGSTPMAMVRDLLVAEGTRRSNMSRLRTWLGDDAAGNPHLPDAYSGHICLSPAVTSDWEQFQSLLAGGVNLSSTPLLREALSLVRGQPLKGVTFQWPWVSQWLGDMLSMITDAATVVADRCLTNDDPLGALWAIDQGLRATGPDEVLTVRRIQALAATGDRAEVKATVTQLTRAARAENRDLTPDSIRRIQQALHSGLPLSTALGYRPNIDIHESGSRPVG